MARNIPSNEKQRPATKNTFSKALIKNGRGNKELLRQTKATLPSMAVNQERRPNKEFPRQKKSKRIYFHQTSSARDAKGNALREGRKRERERNTGITKWQ